jgi:hypothetical protein
MSYLCAILMPSRSAPEVIAKALRSVFDNAETPMQVQAVLRLDEGWLPSDHLGQLKMAFPMLTFVVGPRLNGYHSVPEYLAECGRATDARWLWPLDDDYEIGGRGWDSRLIEVEDQGYFFAQPQFYFLHNSWYNNVGAGYGPQGMMMKRNQFDWVCQHYQAPKAWDLCAQEHARGNIIAPLRGISLRHHWDETRSVARREGRL